MCIEHQQQNALPLAGLMHELKSPLAIIENAIENLERQEQTHTATSLGSSYVQIILKNTLRLRQSVEDLLVLMSSDLGPSPMDPKPLAVLDLVQEIMEAYLPLAAQHNVDLTLVCNDPTLHILGDRPKFSQVLSNLLSNAIKFSPHGRVTVTLLAHGDRLRLLVQDTGMGIPAAELPYIFERFFQGRAAMGRRGSGIGLTISKSWVEAHHGRIWAESAGSGQGTRILVDVPLCSAASDPSLEIAV